MKTFYIKPNRGLMLDIQVISTKMVRNCRNTLIIKKIFYPYTIRVRASTNLTYESLKKKKLKLNI